MKKFTKLIKNYNWTFAETMPEIPHYYIVRSNISKKDQEIFDEFKLFIKKNGYIKKFYGKEYQYTDINGYKYWFIENILNREELND